MEPLNSTPILNLNCGLHWEKYCQVIVTYTKNNRCVSTFNLVWNYRGNYFKVRF